MVYLNGEGNLVSYAKNELNEILNSKGNIYILFDGDMNGDTVFYHVHNGSWEIINNVFHSQELNMGDENTLHEFVEYVFEECPSTHYMLEIWGHGNGWMGVCFDKTDRDMLTLSEIRAAIDKKIDILMFSACYMGNLEVAYEMSSVADYMVACEGALPASSIPHQSIFNAISEEKTPEEISRMIVEKYKENSGYLSTSFASWNLSRVWNMTEKINAFADIMKNFDENAILSMRESSSFSFNYIDLYNFAKQIYEQYGDEIAGEIMKEINEIIISSYGIMDGVSIYFPMPSSFSSSYAGIEFSISSHWDDFIESL